MNATITLREYLAKGKTFVIPSYQRGYVWGKERIDEDDSVTYFLNDLKTRFKNDMDMFLQGFTVTESEREIEIIDGQQRTTCLFLILKWLGCGKEFKLKYAIRKASDEYLGNIDIGDISEVNEKYQDIYFFKKTLRITERILADIDDKDALSSFMLDHIRFLYINIERNQAVNVFTMMNGSKAKMREEELIKAEMLRLASKNTSSSEDYMQEWEHELIRSRYAREWDKWLQWWNREDVRLLYDCDNPMGLLISSYYHSEKNGRLTYENFRKIYFGSGSPAEAKKCFDGLRRLQKRFEDAFNDQVIHNHIGAILAVFNKENRHKFIKHYFADDCRNNLREYYLLAFLGMTHDEITSHDKEKIEKKFAEKYELTYNAINNDFAYTDKDAKEKVFRFLLRLNVDQDNMQNRKFNFRIWEKDTRSLEHIYPKSQVIHQENGKWYNGADELAEYDENDDEILLRSDIKTGGKTPYETTEHCIGNLVLLYRRDNSEFSKSKFARKKVLFFRPSREQFESRHLLHTICVFAEKEKWDGKSIAENKLEMIQIFERDYETLKEALHYEKK